jgi:ubiquinone/menaquinone biosynthesis C-methylase UbiE
VSHPKISKFENPVRLAELNPQQTLVKLGFKEGMQLCDIGAGTGIFSFEAAKLTSEKIYALDISSDMLAIIAQRCTERGINHIVPLQVASGTFPVPSASCNLALLVTVFHEVENKEEMLKEIARLLKPTGQLAIIEFHKRQTPMGPPVSGRLGEEDVMTICTSVGFKTSSKLTLGENFYGLTFTMK